MSFTDQKPFTATEEDCRCAWSGRANGEYFRCGLCGHKFIPGDVVRWQYTNDMPGAGGNPMVCQKCDGPPEVVREKWKAMHEEARTRFWSFIRE